MYDTIKRFKELGKASGRPRSGRPPTARTQKLKNAVKAKKKSMRKIAREMDVSEPTMRSLLKLNRS